MSDFTIYHNQRCSKSRQALALLQASGKEVEIILYQEDVPSQETIRSLLKKLGMSASDILRKKEAAYKAHFKNVTDEEALITLLASHPIVMERPIIVRGDKALVARPPELVQQLLD